MSKLDESKKLLQDLGLPTQYNSKLMRLDTPSPLKLLCEFRTKWSEGFTPFASEDFQVITND